MSGKDGTWIALPEGLREALDLSLIGTRQSRTKWVSILIEDAVIDKLENLDYDVGVMLDNLYPNKNMRGHYKALVKSVHDRRNPAKEEPADDDIVEDEDIELDSNILDSIAKSA